MTLPVPVRRGLALTTCTALVAGLAGLATTAAVAAPGAPGGWTSPAAEDTFHRLSTYPVYLNVPEGVDPADETVAEISAISEDGNTFVHTDAAGRRIGFVDISDPTAPVGTGTLDLAADLGLAEDASPTSVAIVGDRVLVVVDTSADFVNPTGVLVVADLTTHAVLHTIDLGGQPDSIVLTPDTSMAAIAMENQRDEEAAPAGGDEGDLPQLPAGFVQLVDLTPADVTAWTARPVDLVDGDGSALALLADAGLDTPEDPEPEYVAVNPSGSTLAVTLQENNGVVLIDLTQGVDDAAVTRAFSTGSVAVTGIDVEDDGRIDQTGSVPATPREPDAIGWLDDTHVATANEGDWKGGTRGWSVFDTTTGDVVWDAGDELERLAVRTGLHSESRADNKGVEMEGLAVATLGGTPYAFVGSERSNFVAVYDVSVPAAPAFVQVLATTNGPEGLLPVPGRDLLVVSSETDDSEARVRSAVTVFGRGDRWAGDAGTPQFPSVVSADDAAGDPIGWGALGALAPDVDDPTHLWSVTDAAFAETRLLSLDVSTSPAVIDGEIAVTEAGAPVALDAEGIASRTDGGFWLGVEGATGAENRLVRVDAAGAVQETVALPADVTAGLTKWGVEGVTTTTDASGEHVVVALQRGLTTDPGGLGGAARIGRYDVTGGTWTWFSYPLTATSAAGDWMGLSEITAVDADSFAVIERDKLNGPDAAVKAVYQVDLPASTPGQAEVVPLTKTLAADVLPALQATNGWTQEKLEGLTVGGDGQVYVVTDNDGADDATGETVLLGLGAAADLFTTSTTPEPEEPGTPGTPGTPGEPGEPGQPGTEVPGAGATPPTTPLRTVTAGDLVEANRGQVTVTGRLVPGSTVTVSADGFAPGEWVLVTLFSTPADLGYLRAAVDGSVTGSVTLPSTLDAGTHRLALVGQVSGRVVWRTVVIGAVGGAAGDRALAVTGASGGPALAGLASLLVVAGAGGVLLARRRLAGGDLPGDALAALPVPAGQDAAGTSVAGDRADA
ncbi:esterase-like activity of phytase family protein [Cellulomonas sp. Marseille-Q8402]